MGEHYLSKAHGYQWNSHMNAPLCDWCKNLALLISEYQESFLTPRMCPEAWGLLSELFQMLSMKPKIFVWIWINFTGLKHSWSLHNRSLKFSHYWDKLGRFYGIWVENKWNSQLCKLLMWTMTILPGFCFMYLNQKFVVKSAVNPGGVESNQKLVGIS